MQKQTIGEEAKPSELSAGTRNETNDKRAFVILNCFSCHEVYFSITQILTEKTHANVFLSFFSFNASGINKMSLKKASLTSLWNIQMYHQIHLTSARFHCPISPRRRSNWAKAKACQRIVCRQAPARKSNRSGSNWPTKSTLKRCITATQVSRKNRPLTCLVRAVATTPSQKMESSLTDPAGCRQISVSRRVRNHERKISINWRRPILRLRS